MGRVEMLLEKMMEKVSQPPDENRASYHPVDAPASSTPTSMYDSQPQFRSSVFDDVLGQQGEANIAMTPPEPVSVSNLDTLASARQGSSIGRLEKLRQQLAAMLPCQEDVDIFSTSSHGWWLMQRHMLPHLLRIPEEELQKPHDVSIVSRSHPMMIARLLLCVALCIQQLPPDFDPRTLQTKVPLRDMMERNMAFIITNVTSDDELTGSVEGIECFVLQGLYQVLAGNFRRGWLAFRKAVNVAQLMGFHKVSLKTSQDPPDLMETKRHYMWFQIIREVYKYITFVLPHTNG
jgi:hypothetical protein